MFETSRERSEKTANTPALAVPDSASRPGGEQDRLSDAPTAGRFAEFFAGIGLVREAIEPLGWQCVFANDIAPRKEEMYRRRFGDEHFHLGDIHDLGIGDLPRGLDIVTASFPCIDLSLAGNRAGLAGQHSGTIWPFLDIVTALCIQRTPPSAVLLENVTGFLTSRGGAESRRCLPSSGRCRLRHRRAVCRRPLVPAPEPPSTVRGGPATEAGRSVAPVGFTAFARASRAVRRFQAAHPELPFVDLPLPGPPDQAPHALVSVLQEILPDDARWWPEDRTAALVAEMEPQNRRRVHELLAGERDGVATMYRRRRRGRTVGELRPDRLAGCLRTPRVAAACRFWSTAAAERLGSDR